MIIIYIICAMIGFLVVWFSMPWLIRYLKRINLMVKDMNKDGTPPVPISGGLGVMAGLFIGLMTFIFLKVIFSNLFNQIELDTHSLSDLFAATTSILMITFIGFVDDLIIQIDHGASSGLKQWQKPLLTLVATIPLIAINAGNSTMAFPFIGLVNVGLVYPLLFVPIGVVGAANMVNMLAGFNGLETGMGLVYTGMLSLYAYVNESYIAALIAIITFFSLLAFYVFNKYPAKILPGDSLTYLLGGVFACIAIVGNLEKAALICSIPFFIEFFLKWRGKFNVKSYGYYENGKVKSYYDRIYSLPHILTRTGKFTERQITYIFILLELFFSSLIWII